MRKAEITIPASTSNLGASFDACGLALALYLRIIVEGGAGGFQIIPSGEGAEAIARDESNLIARVARFVADHRDREIGGARLFVDNQIPLARGLGSSSAAIIAGVSVYEALSGERLSEEEFFGYALRFEDHGDNLAPSLLGGLVVTCVVARGDRRALATIKRAWPDDVKIVLAIPEFEMDTAEMRRALPKEVAIGDAVFNLQRSALLQAIISERRFDLLSEALRDRLHQPHRAPYGRGLGHVLRLNDETREHPGLLGVAISGAGSTAIAFATENFSEVAAAMSDRFAEGGARARTLEVAVDNGGRTVVASEES
ncbi:MAG TPA: homoserine kinase [Blastocatellia bacterium]|jgi:homoserine kinase|nr:homoserine kinase [Blastocatellia bacterium]